VVPIERNKAARDPMKGSGASESRKWPSNPITINSAATAIAPKRKRSKRSCNAGRKRPPNARRYGKAESPPKGRSITTRSKRLTAAMARTKQKVESGFVLFDVLYQDGTRTSNRKVPASELGGLDGDAPARVCRKAGSHDRRDVRHSSWTDKDDSPITKAIELTGLARPCIASNECARHGAIKSARSGECVGDPPESMSVL
jgi:hypothetical protein